MCNPCALSGYSFATSVVHLVFRTPEQKNNTPDRQSRQVRVEILDIEAAVLDKKMERFAESCKSDPDEVNGKKTGNVPAVHVADPEETHERQKHRGMDEMIRPDAEKILVETQRSRSRYEQQRQDREYIHDKQDVYKAM